MNPDKRTRSDDPADRLNGLLLGRGAVVDLGCGDGAWLDRHPMTDAVGIDLDASNLRSAVRQWRFVEADLDEGIPLDTSSVDAVRANQVVEHIRNPLQFLAEIHRILRPGGMLVITTPNVRYFRHVVRLALHGAGPMTSERAERSLADWDGGHIHYFTARDLEWLASAAGFARVETQALINLNGKLGPVRRGLHRWRRTRFVKGLLSGNLALIAGK